MGALRLAMLTVAGISFVCGSQNLSNILLERLRHSGRPALNSKEQLIVHVLGALYQLVDVRWNDLNLMWDPAEFNGTQEMYLPSSSVWLPELYLYHSVEGSTPIGIQDSAVQVQYFGEVRIFVPFTARALCPINVKYFPFDRQQCNFTFGSWSYKLEAVRFQVESEQINLDDFYDNQEWVLNSSQLKPSTSRYKTEHRDEKYSTVIVHLQLNRESFYYVFNLMIPTTLVSLTAIIGFHAPSSSASALRDSKFRLGITTLLSMGVMLLMVVDEMPKFALSSKPGQRGSFSDVPLLGLFYLSQILTISLGTCTSSIFVVLEQYGMKRPCRTQIPCIIRWLDFDWISLFSCLSHLPNRKKKTSEAIEIGHMADESCSLMDLKSPRNNSYSCNHIEPYSSPKQPVSSYRKALENQSDSFNARTELDRELVAQLERISRLMESISHHLAGIHQNVTRGAKPVMEVSPVMFHLTKCWRRVINRLVIISLLFYLCLVALIIVLFFYPESWY